MFGLLLVNRALRAWRRVLPDLGGFTSEGCQQSSRGSAGGMENNASSLIKSLGSAKAALHFHPKAGLPSCTDGVPARLRTGYHPHTGSVRTGRLHRSDHDCPEAASRPVGKML